MSAALGKMWSQTPDYAIAEWSNALLTTWRAPVSVDALEVSRVASHDLHARHPEGIVVFNVIPFAIPLPESAARKKASDVLGETGGHVLCTTTIIGAQGLWGSAARAVVATITLFSRAPHPHKVFGSIDEGAKWAAPNLVGRDDTAADLAAVAEAIVRAGADDLPT